MIRPVAAGAPPSPPAGSRGAPAARRSGGRSAARRSSPCPGRAGHSRPRTRRAPTSAVHLGPFRQPVRYSKVAIGWRSAGRCFRTASNWSRSKNPRRGGASLSIGKWGRLTTFGGVPCVASAVRAPERAQVAIQRPVTESVRLPLRPAGAPRCRHAARRSSAPLARRRPNAARSRATPGSIAPKHAAVDRVVVHQVIEQVADEHPGRLQLDRLPLRREASAHGVGSLPPQKVNGILPCRPPPRGGPARRANLGLTRAGRPLGRQVTRARRASPRRCS